MKYRVGCTIQVEMEVDAPNEQDAIIIAMNQQEEAVRDMKIRRHWWEYVKEANVNGGIGNDDRTDEGP